MERILVLFRRSLELDEMPTQSIATLADVTGLPFIIKEDSDELTHELIQVLEVEAVPSIVLGLVLNDTLFWQGENLTFYGNTLLDIKYMSDKVQEKLRTDPESFDEA